MPRKGFALVVALIASTGCSTMNNTEKGALVGGGVGTVVGTAIGAATGNPRTGAAVGALGGATLGALAGNKQDKHESAIAQAEHAQAVASQNPPLGLIDVVNLSRGGTDPEVIVNQIRNTQSSYTLSTTDIEYLTQQGVAPRVIRAMQDTRARPAAPVVVREAPVIIERPVYPVWGPPVYGPPAIGFHYSRRLR